MHVNLNDHSFSVERPDELFYRTSFQTEAGVAKTMGPLGILRPLPSRVLGAEKVRLFTYALMWHRLFDVLALRL
jgi:hypothetical protein